MNTRLPYIKELTIAIPVADLNESINWYKEVLGFELLFTIDEMGWAEMQSFVPGVSIGLSQVEQVNPGGPTPTFGVSDIESARTILESQGVKFDGEIMIIPDMVKLLTFFDPDGNSLMFSELLSQG